MAGKTRIPATLPRPEFGAAGCCTRAKPRALPQGKVGKLKLRINHRRPGLPVRRDPIIPVPE